MAVGERRMEDLMKSITNPVVGTVVVYGIGGLGKTWTVRQAYRRAMASRLFDVFIWVSLSVTCTTRHARWKILETLSIAVEDHDNEGSFQKKIHSFLSGRRFLLVIDDAWFTEGPMLDILGVPRPVRNASKVIVTTRTRRTVCVMEPDIVIEQSALSRKESWDLFFEIAGDSTADGFRQMVVERCHGMPLLVVLMAGALKDLSADSVNDELAEKVLSAMENEIATAKFACSMLPGNEVKDCLFYCLLFPGDVGINIDDLIRYWTMEGLVGEGDSTLEATDKAREILRLLLNRHMLYKDDDDHVRMHDVVREALSVLGRQRGYLGSAAQVLVDSSTTDSLNLTSVWLSDGRYQRISLMNSSMDRLPECPHFFFLSTLILRGFHGLKVLPNPFFDDMQILRILDLSSSAIKNLPPSISKLVHLQYFLLKGCKNLEQLRHIRSLENLEVLDASQSTALSIIEPGSFTQMNMLKVLNLSHTSIEVFPAVHRLPELRSLILRGCRRLNFQASEFPVGNLPKFKKLDLSDTAMSEFPFGITNLGRVLNLKLCAENNTLDWKDMQWLQPGLTWDEHAGFDTFIRPGEEDKRSYISVSNANFFQHLDKDSPLWENCFVKFHFRVCPLEEQCKDSEFGFQREDFIFTEAYFRTKYFSYSPIHGRFLEIHHIAGDVAGIEGVLNHAEVIFLNDMKFMKQLSDLDLQNLRVVRECWIQRCDQMETIFNAELEGVSEALRLEKLWISNLEKLSFLCASVDKVSNFTSLKHIHIDCCPNLVGLFSSALRFQNLEILQIRFCDKLESVYEHSVHGEDALPRLHTLRLWELPELKCVCGGILPSIKRLKVKECPKLKALPVGVNEVTPIAIIQGERPWWNNLTWEEQRIKSHLLFRRWHRF